MADPIRDGLTAYWNEAAEAWDRDKGGEVAGDNEKRPGPA